MEAKTLLVNGKDAQKMLGDICHGTLRNLSLTGQIKKVKLGSRAMYDVASLESYVAGLAPVTEAIDRPKFGTAGD